MLKNFKINICFDEDNLKEKYLANNQCEIENLPPTTEIVAQELGWLQASSIQVTDVMDQDETLIIEFVPEDVIDYLEDKNITREQAVTVLARMQNKGFANDDIYQHIWATYISMFEMN